MSGLDDYIREQNEKHPIDEGNPVPGQDPDPGQDPTPGQDPEPGQDPTPGQDPDPGQDPEPGQDPDPQGGVIDDEKLNSFFETTGKTVEDIKSTFTLGTKYSEIESERDEVLQKLEAIQAENAELRKGLNPLSHFSSEESYRAEQLRKKYPTMDPVAIQKAVGSDLSKMEDLDVLALLDAVKRPGAKGGEAMAKRIIADQYGIDLDAPREEWDDMAIAKLERAAIDGRHELKTFQNEVELPTIKSEEDLQAERAQALEELKGQWAEALPVMKNFTKITLPGLEEGKTFDFEVPQDFRDGLDDLFEGMIELGELEPDKDTVAALIEQRNKDFIYQNLDKILEARDADLRTLLTKRTDQELNNDTPPNSNTKPQPGQELTGTEQHLAGRKGRVKY
jgi:hypothetical protein